MISILIWIIGCLFTVGLFNGDLKKFNWWWLLPCILIWSVMLGAAVGFKMKVGQSE